MRLFHVLSVCGSCVPGQFRPCLVSLAPFFSPFVNRLCNFARARARGYVCSTQNGGICTRRVRLRLPFGHRDVSVDGDAELVDQYMPTSSVIMFYRVHVALSLVK